MVQIILNEWAGYGLFREKILGENVIECGLGRLLENIALHGGELKVTLVVNTDMGEKRWFIHKALGGRDHHLPYAPRYLDLQRKFSFISKVVFRSNFGRDIGAYNCGYQLLKKANYDGDVIFMNTGLSGPDAAGWIDKYRNVFYGKQRVGLCGITMNSHNTSIASKPFLPHVQSFFLFSNMAVLKDVFPFNLCGIWIRNNKELLIAQGEIGISQRILQKGYGLCCTAFPGFYYFKGDNWLLESTGELRFDKKYANVANKI